MSSTPAAVALTRHAQTPSAAVSNVRVRLARSSAVLAVSYEVEGEIERVRIPPPGPRCVTDKLWEHTCCEVFVARQGTSAYHEFNFSPSGDWAVYAFARYRERADLDEAAALDPHIALRRDPKKLQLDALVRLDRLSAAHTSAPLSLALAAVIEEHDGRLSYWALAHPAARPDFHHPDNFALTLDEIRH